MHHHTWKCTTTSGPDWQNWEQSVTPKCSFSCFSVKMTRPSGGHTVFTSLKVCTDEWSPNPEQRCTRGKGYQQRTKLSLRIRLDPEVPHTGRLTSMWRTDNKMHSTESRFLYRFQKHSLCKCMCCLFSPENVQARAVTGLRMVLKGFHSLANCSNACTQECTGTNTHTQTHTYSLCSSNISYTHSDWPGMAEHVDSLTA